MSFMSFFTDIFTLFPRNQTAINTSQNDENHQSSFQRLPDELILHIFGFLSPWDLCRVSCVCREWQSLASDEALWNAFDLKQRFRSVTFLDEQVWEKHADLKKLGLSFEKAPADKNFKIPPFNQRDAIKALIAFNSLNLEEKEITCLTLPRGLSLEKLEILAQDPKNARPIGLSIPHDLPQEYNDRVLQCTVRMVMVNSPLKKNKEISSRELPFEDQEGLKEEMKEKLGKDCERIPLLAATAYAVLTCLEEQSPFERLLFSGYNFFSSRINTCCFDKSLNMDKHFIVQYSVIHTIPTVRIVYNYNSDEISYGLKIQRMFVEKEKRG